MSVSTSELTLTEFLLARIAEDERDADEGLVAEGSWRVLAECAAKRRVVELHTGEHECVGIKYGRQDTVYVHPDFVFRHDPTLRILAAVYADHDDYQDEWAL